jgi:uncharacterized repeat protein (TIGR01451 family)
MRSRVARHAASSRSRRRRPRLRARILETGFAALAVVGLVAYSAPAYAHTNPVSAASSCQAGPGSGWQVTWTIQNDENLSENVTVTAATGGLSTLSATTVTIAPTPPGQPNSSATVTQKLPASAIGATTLSFTGTWSDGYVASNSGTYSLSANSSCGTPATQTIAGQINLCNNGNPTATNVSGGTIGASGPVDLKPVAAPMAPTDVPAGAYTLTATAPPGYTLAACHGGGVPAANGLSATETVSVPTGGHGDGIFYAAPASSVYGAPSIALQQSAAESSYSAAGQTITYHFAVTNTGKAVLSKVTVAHPRTGSTVSCPASTLAAGAQETCTASYVTTSADVAAGKIVDTATATGTTPTGSTVTSSPSTLTLTILPQASGISLVKSSIFANYNAVGEHIPFDFLVTNTGADALDSITINDDNAGVVLTPCPDPTLAVGAQETCHGHYVVTQADLSAGSIVNTATASGINSAEATITSAPSTVTLLSVQRINGHIFQCFSTGPSDLEVPGGTLGAVGPLPATTVAVATQPNPIHPPIPVATGNYTMTATNPPGWVFVECPTPGAASNKVTTASISPDGGTATETVSVPNGGVGTGDFFVEHATPGVTLKKTAAQPFFSGAGQSITFDFLVTNTGNIGLDNVGITDTLAGVTGLSCPQPVLGAGLAETCTGKYTTTAADVTAQSIVNHATAHGTPPKDPMVTSGPSAATVPLLAVTITKAGSPTSIVAGSTTPIVYTLTVKNTGKVTTTTPLNIADSAPVGTTMVSGSAACASGGPPTCSVAVAAPTVTWTIASGVKPGQVYMLTFKVTANSSDPTGHIINTALWNGSACAAGSCTTDTVTIPVTGHAGTSSSSSSSSSKLAFTGALLAQQWMVGLGVILAGGALLVASHRRRSPKHAAGTRWGFLELLLVPQSRRHPSRERKD